MNKLKTLVDVLPFFIAMGLLIGAVTLFCQVMLPVLIRDIAPPDCPLTFREFVDKERARRFCSVMEYKGTVADWTLPNVRLVSTGAFYECDSLGWGVSIHVDSDCNCVPELSPGPHRVVGKITWISPSRITISGAVIDPQDN